MLLVPDCLEMATCLGDGCWRPARIAGRVAQRRHEVRVAIQRAKDGRDNHALHGSKSLQPKGKHMRY